MTNFRLERSFYISSSPCIFDNTFVDHPFVSIYPILRFSLTLLPSRSSRIVRGALIQSIFQIKLILLHIAVFVHGFGTFTTLKEPKGITVTEDSVTDTSLFLTWDAVPKGPFTFKLDVLTQNLRDLYITE